MTRVLLFCLLPLTQISAQETCLPEAQEIAIDSFMEIFEENVASYYETEPPLSADHYQRYLTTFTRFDMDVDFFHAPEQIEAARAMRTSELFGLIWEDHALIEEMAGDAVPLPATLGMVPPYEWRYYFSRKHFYTINPYAAFYECLMRETDKESLAEVFRWNQAIPGLSPAVISSRLSETEAFHEPSAKRLIAFKYYYENLFIVHGLGEVPWPDCTELELIDSLWYLNDEKYSGICRSHLSNGQIDSEGVFYQGLMQEHVFYHANGQMAEKVYYVNGLANGQVTYYHTNGQVAEQGDVVDGAKYGEWKTFYEDGTLKTKEHYQDDQLHGKAFAYTESGQLEIEGYFENGLEEGEWLFYDTTTGEVEGKLQYRKGEVVK